MDAWHTLVVILVVVVLAQGLVLVGLMRQVGGIYLQVGAPRPGRAAGHGPEVGQTVDPSKLGLTQPAILFFLSPTCSLCPVVARAIPVAQAHFPELTFIPAVVGSAAADKAEYAASLGPNARTDLDSLYEQWEVAGTPFAVALTADGAVRTSGIVNSLPQIETLATELGTAIASAGQAIRVTRHLEEEVA